MADVLVWTGDRPSSRHQPPSAAAYHTGQSLRRRATPARESPRRTPEAERRQLTVLFCDLVDSTVSPASSTRKTCARWCGPIKTPAPR